MARKKKGRRRQGLFSKAINAGLIALGFSRVLTHLLSGQPFNLISAAIIREATFGLANPLGESQFDLNAGLQMYAPGAAALGLGTLKKFLMKKFPVR